jgi:hypothetical protein
MLGGAFKRIPGIGVIAEWATHLGGFTRLLAMGLPRLLGWVGWITLAIDALHWFSQHPKDIGTFIGEIIKLFRDVLIPGGVNLVKMFVKYILEELGKLWDMVTHLNKIPDWFSQTVQSVQKVLAQPPPNTGGSNKQGPHGHPAPGGGHHGQVALVINANYSGSVDPKQARQHAAHLTKHVVAFLKDAQYSTVGGNGVPGRPSTLAGVG